MTNEQAILDRWIEDITILMEKNQSIDSAEAPFSFIQRIDLIDRIVILVDELSEDEIERNNAHYSACVFVLENCVSELKSAQDYGNKLAGKRLNQLMTTMAAVIGYGHHTLGFWLPILNAFYETRVELLPELKNAYLELASQEESLSPDEEAGHLNTIRDIIVELSGLSVFAMAEHFFAQSYAMPTDFFMDLVVDLCSIEEGQDIGLLILLHPKQEVREIVIETLEQLMQTMTLSSASLSRLKVIKNWYPATYHERFERWLRIQRKKGVVFSSENAVKPQLKIKASEVDGGGAQGLFIEVKKNRKTQLCGLMLKQGVGVKDAWVTREIRVKDMAKCYSDAIDVGVTLREVDQSYLTRMVEHFLALTLQEGNVPDLHLLEIQELIGVHFTPNLFDIPYLMDQLSVKIMPFTPDVMQTSLQRSRSWFQKKRFAQSWFVENAHVDKLVNRCCSFEDGVKQCALEKAMSLVFAQELEAHRDKWLFHFLWTALWLWSVARKNEKAAQDSFFIAYAIHTEVPLKSIPIMHEVCRQTVINSLETMAERGTYINKE